MKKVTNLDNNGKETTQQEMKKIIEKYELDKRTREFLLNKEYEIISKFYHCIYESQKRLLLVNSLVQNDDCDKIEGTELTAVQDILKDIHAYINVSCDIYYTFQGSLYPKVA